MDFISSASYKAELKKRRRIRRIKRIIGKSVVWTLSVLLITCLIFLFVNIIGSAKKPHNDEFMNSNQSLNKSINEQYDFEAIKMPDYVNKQLLNVGCARTGQMLDSINNIVIHYVGNPNTTAKNNRDFFAMESTEVCSHFVIGLKGEVIQCVPLNERSAASNHRNKDTISIEVCHPDKTGKFNKATYDSLVKLTSWLCETFDLKSDDVIRHYDITGKECPLYYVNNPNEWKAFIKDVEKAIKK